MIFADKRPLRKAQNIMRLLIKIGVAGNAAAISFACAFLWAQNIPVLVRNPIAWAIVNLNLTSTLSLPVADAVPSLAIVLWRAVGRHVHKIISSLFLYTAAILGLPSPRSKSLLILISSPSGTNVK